MTALVEIDGRTVTRPHVAESDVVIVGSGPAGATVARALALAGLSVIVLEEGFEVRPAEFEPSGLRAMAQLYRDMGTSIAFGRAPMPFLQGRAVGGTSVVNGAICWRLSREVLEEWYAADGALREALDFAAIERAEDEIEARLHIHPTEPAVAGPKNLRLGVGAEALGVAHRPIRRNVENCVGEGRCLQGCPHGHKLSMDRTFLPDAVHLGARIFSGVTALRVNVEGGRAAEVVARAASGASIRVRARHAVVLAASAIQTPCLLMQSGLRAGPVGRELSGHPGVSVTGRFDEPVRNHRGATQGHEVTGWRGEGIKIEALGFDLSILASRLPGAGTEFARRIAEIDRYAVWGAALRARARGTVRPGLGRARVRFSLTREDVVLARRAVRLLADTMLAAGATEVHHEIAGWGGVIRDRRGAAAIEEQAPLDARAYPMSMTHLFGTARMGSNPATSVVRTDFRHHTVSGLYVADSSVFPSNLGVNPQIPIMALARLCADRVLNRSSRDP